MKRLFFALDISAHDKQLIANWRDQQLPRPYNAINPQNFHITLCFLGNVNQSQQNLLITTANEFKPQITLNNETELLLDHCGLFKKPKVLYLGLKNCPNWLALLADSLSAESKTLGLFQEDRPYLPHLSIYRKAMQVSVPFAIKLPFTVNSFSLYQSITSEHGVNYQAIKTWQLSI